jgi:hypothetical protein
MQITYILITDVKLYTSLQSDSKTHNLQKYRNQEYTWMVLDLEHMCPMGMQNIPPGGVRYVKFLLSSMWN